MPGDQGSKSLEDRVMEERDAQTKSPMDMQTVPFECSEEYHSAYSKELEKMVPGVHIGLGIVLFHQQTRKPHNSQGSGWSTQKVSPQQWRIISFQVNMALLAPNTPKK